jgi:imidazole glycerol phosphate synthase glutamine amidotransferase subunit
MSLVVAPTGTANTSSVLAAFRRLGVEPTIAARVDHVRAADRVVLPGVGSFGSAMAELERRGLAETLSERVRANRPTLAICVGMQLLASASEESVDVRGLSVIDQEVSRFPDVVLVPQLGWNRVAVPGTGSRFLTDGWAYFDNSFRMVDVPDGWSAAMADHGGSFVAAIERGDVLACQFHPELSGPWGSGVLSRWLRGAA